MQTAASKTEMSTYRMKGSLSSQHDPTVHNWTLQQNWCVHQAITKIQTSAGLPGLIAALHPSTHIALRWAGGKDEAELLSHTLLLSLMALLSLLPSCWGRDSSRPCNNQGGLGGRATICVQTLCRVSDNRTQKQPFHVMSSNLLKTHLHQLFLRMKNCCWGW